MFAPRFPTVWCYRANRRSDGDSTHEGVAPAARGSAQPIERLEVVLPLWFLFAAAVGVTVLLFWLERRARPRKGYCSACGYDLTGLQSGACPECGEAVVLTGVEDPAAPTGRPPPVLGG